MGFVSWAAKRGGDLTRKLFKLLSILITIVATMAFGFYSDRPFAVDSNPKSKPLRKRMSQWAGAGFWLMVSFALVLIQPLLGLPAVLFAAFVVMRRVAASRGFGWPLASMRKELRTRLGKPGLSLMGLAAAVLLADSLGFRASFTDLSRILCYAAIMGAAFWVAGGFTRFRVAQDRLHFLYDNKLAAILGVSETLVNGTGLQFDKKDGELTVFPLPPQAAFKRGDIEAKLRQVAPEWEYVVAKSGHEKVVLAAASVETEQNRATLAASGGLIAGMSQATGAEQDTVDLPDGYVDTVENHAALSGALDAQVGGGWSIQEIRGAEAVVVRGTPDPRPSAKEFYLGEDLKLSDGGRVAKNILKTEGLIMVAWDPEEDLAIAVNLLPSTVELRERLARELGKEPWQVELSPRYDGGELKSVTILRHDTKISGDRDKRIAFWLDKAQNVVGHRGWYVEVDDKSGRVSFIAGTIRSLPRVVPMAELLPASLNTDGWAELPLGLNPEREVTSIDLRLGPHSVLVGPTGSGKSVAMRQMMTAALSRGHDVILVDAIKEGADFMSIKPWCAAWGETIQEAADVIVTAYKEGVRRKAILKQHGVGFWEDLPEYVRKRENIKPVLLMVDEFVSLILLESIPKTLDKESAVFKEATRTNEQKAFIAMYCGKIARESRFVGIHLGVAMQRPDAGLMGGGEFRSNLTSAIQLVKPGKQPSRDALGMVFAGDELVSVTETLSELDDGRSRGLGVMSADGGEVGGFRVGFTDASEIPALLEAIGVPYPEPWVIEPAVAYDDDTEPQPAFSAARYADPVVKDLGAMELSMDDLEMTVEEPEATTVLVGGTSPASVSAGSDPFESGYAVADKVRTQAVGEDDPFAEPVRSRTAVPALDDGEDPFAEAPAKKPAAADKFADFSFD